MARHSGPPRETDSRLTLIRSSRNKTRSALGQSRIYSEAAAPVAFLPPPSAPAGRCAHRYPSAHPHLRHFLLWQERFPGYFCLCQFPIHWRFHAPLVMLPALRVPYSAAISCAAGNVSCSMTLHTPPSSVLNFLCRTCPQEKIHKNWLGNEFQYPSTLAYGSHSNSSIPNLNYIILFLPYFLQTDLAHVLCN